MHAPYPAAFSLPLAAVDDFSREEEAREEAPGDDAARYADCATRGKYWSDTWQKCMNAKNCKGTVQDGRCVVGATGDGDDAGVGDGDGGGDGDGTPELPAPDAAIDRRCVTYMSSDKDSGECLAVVYNACVPGRTSQDAIPASIRSNKASILKQIHGVAAKDIGARPTDWAGVCVARPDKAGKGRCKHVKPGEFRVWVAGKGTDVSECRPSGSLFVKSHFDGNGTIRGHQVGKVGHV